MMRVMIDLTLYATVEGRYKANFSSSWPEDDLSNLIDLVLGTINYRLALRYYNVSDDFMDISDHDIRTAINAMRIKGLFHGK